MREINRNLALALYGQDDFFGTKPTLHLDDVVMSGCPGVLKNNFSRKRKAKTIMFYNVKGGVGKTTLSFQAARFLALHGFKVCVLGVDSSASLTKSFFGPEADSISPRFWLSTILQKIYMREDFSSQPTDIPNLDVIAEREDIEREFKVLFDKWGRPEGYRPAEIFKEVLIPSLSPKYDFIIIDAPPRIDEGLLPRNALRAADRVIIPIDSGVNTFEDFIDRYGLIEQAVGPNASKKIKIVFNNFEKWAFCRQVEVALREMLPNQIIEPGIMRSASINAARSERLSVFEKYPKAKVSNQVICLLTNIFNDVMEIKNEHKSASEIAN